MITFIREKPEPLDLYINSNLQLDYKVSTYSFPALFEAFTKKSERANALREKWELGHPSKAKG